MPKESHKQKEVTLRSGLDPRQGPGTDTVPDLGLPLRLGVSTDTLPEQAGVYVPPRPLASASDHRTIEIQPVRLAQDIDPRRAPTELRLAAPPPRKQARPLFWVLTALLAIAVGGFFVARLVVSPPDAPSAAPGPVPSPVAAPAPQPAPAPTSGSIIVGAPISQEPAEEPGPGPEAEPALVPVTPAELGARPKAAAPAPSPRDSAGAQKKKPREPWLE
jgi:hypothetical protein